MTICLCVSLSFSLLTIDDVLVGIDLREMPKELLLAGAAQRLPLLLLLLALLRAQLDGGLALGGLLEGRLLVPPVLARRRRRRIGILRRESEIEGGERNVSVF